MRNFFIAQESFFYFIDVWSDGIFIMVKFSLVVLNGFPPFSVGKPLLKFLCHEIKSLLVKII